MSENSTQQVAWNIGGDQGENLSKLINKAEKAYLSGDFVDWYVNMSALREFVVNHDLSIPEKEKLDILEKRIAIIYRHWIKEQIHITTSLLDKERYTAQRNCLIARRAYFREVRQYHRILMTHLKKLGYFPKKDDRTKLRF